MENVTPAPPKKETLSEYRNQFLIFFAYFIMLPFLRLFIFLRLTAQCKWKGHTFMLSGVNPENDEINWKFHVSARVYAFVEMKRTFPITFQHSICSFYGCCFFFRHSDDWWLRTKKPKKNTYIECVGQWCYRFQMASMLTGLQFFNSFVALNLSNPISTLASTSSTAITLRNGMNPPTLCKF